jgi:DNA-binding MarR family transcriptional regulator
MGRTAKISTRKANGGARPAGPDASRELDLTALQQTPGFLIRILQLQNFEAFYPYFEALKLSPLEYAILVAVRDNKAVTQSELAAVLRMQLPNLVKILSRMEETGVLKRKRSTRDKRAVELSLSAAGERRADEAGRLGERFNAQTLSALSKPEQTAFLQMLVRLVKAHKNGL